MPRGEIVWAVRALAFDRLSPAVRDRLTRAWRTGRPRRYSARVGVAPLVLRALQAAVDSCRPGGAGRFLLGFRRAVRRAGGPVGVVRAGVRRAPGDGGPGGASDRLAGAVRSCARRSGRGATALARHGGGGRRTPRVTCSTRCARSSVCQRQATVVFEDGEAAVFPAGKHEDPAALAARSSVVAGARALVYPADEAKLGRLDPFFEVRATEDWEARSSRGAAPAPAWQRGRAVVAAAAPAGYGLLVARNAPATSVFDERPQPAPGGGAARSSTIFPLHRAEPPHAAEAGRAASRPSVEDRTALASYQLDGGRSAGWRTTRSSSARAATRPGGVATPERAVPVAEADEVLFAVAHRLIARRVLTTTSRWARGDVVEVRSEARPGRGHVPAGRGLGPHVGPCSRSCSGTRAPGTRTRPVNRSGVIYADALDGWRSRRCVEAPERLGLRRGRARRWGPSGRSTRRRSSPQAPATAVDGGGGRSHREDTGSATCPRTARSPGSASTPGRATTTRWQAGSARPTRRSCRDHPDPRPGRRPAQLRGRLRARGRIGTRLFAAAGDPPVRDRRGRLPRRGEGPDPPRRQETHRLLEGPPPRGPPGRDCGDLRRAARCLARGERRDTLDGHPGGNMRSPTIVALSTLSLALCATAAHAEETAAARCAATSSRSGHLHPRPRPAPERWPSRSTASCSAPPSRS